MKKIIACTMICVMMLILCGCVHKEGKKYDICENVSFTLVEKTGCFILYVHNETGVMYICKCSKASDTGSGFSVMLDENGNPLIYKSYTESEDTE